MSSLNVRRGGVRCCNHSGTAPTPLRTVPSTGPIRRIVTPACLAGLLQRLPPHAPIHASEGPEMKVTVRCPSP
jgi:hypothetical protein